MEIETARFAAFATRQSFRNQSYLPELAFFYLELKTYNLMTF